MNFHNLSALLFILQEEQTAENLGGTRMELLPITFNSWMLATPVLKQIITDSAIGRLFLTYRLNYDYNGSISYKHSSTRWLFQVCPAKPLGYISILFSGLRISKENFFTNLTNVVNDLKIRPSLRHFRQCRY
jgi:hypothetical protein